MLSSCLMCKTRLIDYQWNHVGVDHLPARSDYHQFRPWHKAWYAELKDEPHTAINAAPGAGKTFISMVISEHKMTVNPRLRTIVIVPRTLIGKGFHNVMAQLPNGKKICCLSDTCLVNEDESTIDQVFHFLKTAHSGPPNERRLVCTQQTLSMAFRRDPRRFKKLFKSVLLIVDEAHHCSVYGEEGLNILGEIMLCVVPEPTVQTLSMTATAYRADGADIFPKKYRSTLKMGVLDFEDYMEHVRPFSYFSFDFLDYRDTYVPGVTALFNERVGKTIIYAPWANRSHSLGSRKRDVTAILSCIGKPFNHDGKVTHVKRGSTVVKVLDLASPENRRAKKDHLWETKKNGSCREEMPDVVITLNMMNEGVDWPCNDRQIMIGPVGSLGLLIQRKGRGDRAYPGKDRLEIIMAVKKGLDAGSEETRDEANQYLKTLMYGVLTGDMVKPVRIACPKKDTDEKIVGAREDRFHPGDVMKEQQVAAFLADVFKGYMVWAVGHPTEKEDPAARRTAFMEIASEWLAGKRQKAHVALLSEWAWRIAQLHSGKKFKGVDIGHIQVELLNEEPFGDLFRMAS